LLLLLFRQTFVLESGRIFQFPGEILFVEIEGLEFKALLTIEFGNKIDFDRLVGKMAIPK
jgi:hypothetical protein